MNIETIEIQHGVISNKAIPYKILKGIDLNKSLLPYPQQFMFGLTMKRSFIK